MATDTERLVVSLEARIRDFERNMDKAAGTASRQFTSIERRGATSARRLETSMSSAARGVNAKLATIGVGAFAKLTAALAPLAVLGAAGALGKSFLEKTIAQEEAVAQLNAVLKSTGGVAGVTSQAAQDLAASLQKVTTFGDEAIIPAESLLLDLH